MFPPQGGGRRDLIRPQPVLQMGVDEGGVVVTVTRANRGELGSGGTELASVLAQRFEHAVPLRVVRIVSEQDRLVDEAADDVIDLVRARPLSSAYRMHGG